MNGKEPRSLTLPEVRALRLIENPNEADAAMLAWAYGSSVEEAAAWFHAAPAKEALDALNKAWQASGLTEDAQFPDQTADVPVAGGAGE